MAELEFTHLMDITLPIEAVVEGPALKLSELLNLSAGSLIATRRAAGEHLDVYAGGAYIGCGEWTRANGCAAVRILNFK
jgi:flagellar motor switch/type III secretory pathway protein FliN